MTIIFACRFPYNFTRLYFSLDYKVVILNWRLLRLNSWPYCFAIPRDIARHGSNSLIWFTREMPDFLILKLMLSLLDCMRNLLVIIFTKPPIQNDSSIVSLVNLNAPATKKLSTLKSCYVPPTWGRVAEGEEVARRGEGRVVGVRTPLFLRALEFRALELRALVLRLVLTRPPVQSPPVLRRVGVGLRTLLELTAEWPRPPCLLDSCWIEILRSVYQRS